MEKDTKKLKKFQKWLNKYIKRNFGKKCTNFVWNCPVCRAYFVKELFDDFVNDSIETEKWFEKETKSKLKVKK